MKSIYSHILSHWKLNTSQTLISEHIESLMRFMWFHTKATSRSQAKFAQTPMEQIGIWIVRVGTRTFKTGRHLSKGTPGKHQVALKEDVSGYHKNFQWALLYWNMDVALMKTYISTYESKLISCIARWPWRIDLTLNTDIMLLGKDRSMWGCGNGKFDMCCKWILYNFSIIRTGIDRSEY